MKVSVSKYISHIIIQLAIATGILFLLMYFINLRFEVILASIGATTFIIFVSPGSEAAKNRNVILGTIIGCVIGTIGFFLSKTSLSYNSLIYSLTIGFTALILIITRCFHPPAAGYALGMAIEGANIYLFASVIISITIMVLVHYFLGHYLVNLIERRKVHKHEVRQ